MPGFIAGDTFTADWWHKDGHPTTNTSLQKTSHLKGCGHFWAIGRWTAQN